MLGRGGSPARLLAAVLLGLVAALSLAAVAGVRTAHAGVGGGHYHALATPTRVLDTRNGTGHSGPVEGGQTINLALSVGGVAESDLVAVVVNVTVTDPQAVGYVTVWPTGSAQPATSNLNWNRYTQVSNLVTTAVGPGENVSFHVDNSRTHLVADLYGYFSSAAETGREFRPLMSARILDTRTGVGAPAGRLVGGTPPLTLQVAGRGNVPSSGVSAVVLQVTAVAPSANSYLAVCPHGADCSQVSSVIFPAGYNVGGRVIVGLGSGQVDIYQSVGDSDVVADVNGYFTGPGANAGGLFVPIQPVRVLDSRSGLGHTGRWASGQGSAVPISGPPANLPAGSSAAMLNLTSVNATSGTFLTTYPTGNHRTLSSDVNVSPGPAQPNLTVAKLGGDGSVIIYNGSASADVLADVVGYFTAAPVPGTVPSAPQNLISSPDNRAGHLRWDTPGDLGGTQVVSWAIQISDGREQVEAADASTAVIIGLINTQTYNFTVVAINAVGSSTVSNSVAITPVGTADPPIILSVTPGMGSISITWQPPANNGGFPIVYYIITVFPGGWQIGCPLLSITIPNLSSDTVYTFAFQTANTYGASEVASYAPPVRPLGLRRIVISLSQQNLVAWSGGGVVLTTLVTTGRPELPTPLGVWHIFDKQSPIHFISPWGPGSPFWYQDAWAVWGMQFIPGGYFLHDAPWRSWYGPGSQYGDGTHGCVNIPHDAMRFLFSWAQIGDEVDVIG